MDGARLMNAVVASGTPAAEYAAPFDSLWLDFSKGLGAPVGAVLAGSKAFVHEAWRVKQQIGGAMRQAGIIAAACLYALDHHVERLAEDHANAKALAEGLAEIPGIAIDPATRRDQHRLVRRARPLGADEVAASLKEQGVLIGGYGQSRMRAVTHLDVDRAGIEVALDAMRRVHGLRRGVSILTIDGPADPRDRRTFIAPVWCTDQDLVVVAQGRPEDRDAAVVVPSTVPRRAGAARVDGSWPEPAAASTGRTSTRI